MPPNTPATQRRFTREPIDADFAPTSTPPISPTISPSDPLHSSCSMPPPQSPSFQSPYVPPGDYVTSETGSWPTVTPDGGAGSSADDSRFPTTPASSTSLPRSTRGMRTTTGQLGNDRTPGAMADWHWPPVPPNPFPPRPPAPPPTNPPLQAPTIHIPTTTIPPATTTPPRQTPPNRYGQPTTPPIYVPPPSTTTRPPPTPPNRYGRPITPPAHVPPPNPATRPPQPPPTDYYRLPTPRTTTRPVAPPQPTLQPLAPPGYFLQPLTTLYSPPQLNMPASTAQQPGAAAPMTEEQLRIIILRKVLWWGARKVTGKY
jgi:hypothetical protein